MLIDWEKNTEKKQQNMFHFDSLVEVRFNVLYCVVHVNFKHCQIRDACTALSTYIILQ
jgi:hypothetical protein